MAETQLRRRRAPRVSGEPIAHLVYLAIIVNGDPAGDGSVPVSPAYIERKTGLTLDEWDTYAQWLIDDGRVVAFGRDGDERWYVPDMRASSYRASRS
jgi:hypothetical protein